MLPALATPGIDMLDAVTAGSGPVQTQLANPGVWNLQAGAQRGPRALTQVVAAAGSLHYASSMLELDVRVVSPPQKHPTIHAMLEKLSPGEALRITNDHDPRPLRFEVDHDYPNIYRFDYLQSGPQTWVVDIVRDAKDAYATPTEAGHGKRSNAPDLRTSVPRSGRFMLGRYVWLARLADKVRAKQAGTIGEYSAFCPISLGFLDRLNVSLAEFSSFVAAGSTDGQLVTFLDTRANDQQRALANRWVLVENADDLRRQDEEEGQAPEFALTNHLLTQ